MIQAKSAATKDKGTAVLHDELRSDNTTVLNRERALSMTSSVIYDNLNFLLQLNISTKHIKRRLQYIVLLCMNFVSASHCRLLVFLLYATDQCRCQTSHLVHHPGEEKLHVLQVPDHFVSNANETLC